MPIVLIGDGFRYRVNGQKKKGCVLLLHIVEDSTV